MLQPGQYKEDEAKGAYIFPKGSPLSCLSGLPFSRLSFTHYKKAYNIAVVQPAAGSLRQLYVCGSTQRGRVLAHFPKAPVDWVGQCTYVTQLVYEEPTYYVVPFNRFTGEVREPIATVAQLYQFEQDDQIARIAHQHKNIIGMWQDQDLPQEQVFDTLLVTFRKPESQPLHKITLQIWRLDTLFGEPHASCVTHF